MSPEEKKRARYKALYSIEQEDDTHWGYTIAYILAKELNTPLPTAMNMLDVDAIKFIKLYNESIKKMKKR